MSDLPEKPEETATSPETVRCAVCRREIPRIDAIKDEGREYVLWYCGLNCYEKGQQSGSQATRE